MNLRAGAITKLGASGFDRRAQTVVLIAAVLTLIFAADLFVYFYVSKEHCIYFWDWSQYWIRYTDVSYLLRSEPAQALRAVFRSISTDDYNPVPILPLVPVDWAFGPSRLPYILGIANMALLPSALLLAALGGRILRQGSPAQLAVCTAAILCMHVLWVPVLRGMPDVLGISVLSLVLLLHFSKPIGDQRPLQLVATGLLLCLLVLTRRWYLFWAVSFFPALAVAHGLELQKHGPGWKKYAPLVKATAVIGFAFGVFISIVAAPLVVRILQSDYSVAYSAYRYSSSPAQAAVLFLRHFGYLPFLISIAGLVWLLAQVETRTFGVFILVQAALIFVLFSRIQDFGIQHYYLLAPAAALGVITVVMRLWGGSATWIWRVSSVALVFAVELASSATAFYPLNIVGAELLPEDRYFPLVRSDLKELDRLLDRLTELNSQRLGDTYVVASSAVLNWSILDVACRQEQRTLCGRIQVTQEIDKRDGFPQAFLRAEYAVLATPTQYHLRPQDQFVVTLLARDLREHRGIGASFQKVPGEFQLDGDVRVEVYRKTSDFRAEDVQALGRELTNYYPAMGSMFTPPREYSMRTRR